MPAYMFIWDFIALDDDPTSSYGADGNAIVKVVEEYDAALGDLLAALQEKSLLDSTNILFTLDHGKVDTHNQVALGTHGESTDTTGATIAADGQLGALVAAQGAALGITPADYAILNEDGDAQIYARVAGAGTDAGAARQAEVTHALLSLIQSGQIHGPRHHAHHDRRRRDGHADLPRLPRLGPQPGRHRRVPHRRLDAEPGRRHQHAARARSSSTRSSPTAGTAASPTTSSTCR